MTDQPMEPEDKGADTKGGPRYEMLCGVLLAIFASLLAVVDMGAGKAGDDELLVNNDRAAAYSWYQSKSVKQSLAEGQRDILKSLSEAGALAAEQEQAVGKTVGKLTSKINRYGREKTELLLGSAAVGEDNWAQDNDGELGLIIGAQEYEALAGELAASGDTFDTASLLLQLSLVLGAVSLLFRAAGPRWLLFSAMLAGGLIGAAWGALAWQGYLAIG